MVRFCLVLSSQPRTLSTMPVITCLGSTILVYLCELYEIAACKNRTCMLLWRNVTLPFVYCLILILVVLGNSVNGGRK